jgi:hypothetical protein
LLFHTSNTHQNSRPPPKALTLNLQTLFSRYTNPAPASPQAWTLISAKRMTRTETRRHRSNSTTHKISNPKTSNNSF